MEDREWQSLVDAQHRAICQRDDIIETLLQALATERGLTVRQVSYQVIGRSDLPLNPSFHPN